MKAIMEYEFTVTFQDFYKHEKGRRRRPTTLQEFTVMITTAPIDNAAVAIASIRFLKL